MAYREVTALISLHKFRNSGDFLARLLQVKESLNGTNLNSRLLR